MWWLLLLIPLWYWMAWYWVRWMVKNTDGFISEGEAAGAWVLSIVPLFTLLFLIVSVVEYDLFGKLNRAISGRKS